MSEFHGPEDAIDGITGRGVAVVASEVKSLAEQTAKATGEITRQISEIQETTHASVASINAIREVIRKADQVSSAISVAIEKASGWPA